MSADNVRSSVLCVTDARGNSERSKASLTAASFVVLPAKAKRGDAANVSAKAPERTKIFRRDSARDECKE